MTNYELYCEAINECLRDRYPEVKHFWDIHSPHKFVGQMAKPVREALDWAVAKGLADHKSLSHAYYPAAITCQLFVSTGAHTGYWNHTVTFTEMFPELVFDPDDAYERAMTLIEPRPEHARRRKRYHDDY